LANLNNFNIDTDNIDIYKNYKFDRSFNFDRKYIIIHLDEKWFRKYYYRDFTDINPNSDQVLLFINKIIEKSKKIKLNDDAYKEKILNAEDIYDEYEYDIINANIMNNMASEKDKFKMQKYEFKKFWKLENIKKQDLDKYFRCEIIYNRLMVLLNKKKNTLNEDKYIDYDINKKMEVIKNIINTLGFDLNNLTIKIPRDDYYEKIKVLLSNENSFKKDYDKIRILFDKNRHNLNDNITESAINKILNGFLENFGFKIIKKQIRKSVKKVITKQNIFMLIIETKYNIKK